MASFSDLNFLEDKPGWLIWGIGLILIFPIVVILLGEICHRLDRCRHRLAFSIRVLRSIIVPLLLVMLFASKVVEISSEERGMKVLTTITLIGVIYFALLFLKALIFHVEAGDNWRSRMPRLMQSLVLGVLITLGVAVVFSEVWGLDLKGIITAFGIGSIVIGLALQDTLGGLFSGIALLFEKPFVVGDWVKINDIVGRVEEINWRSTRLLRRRDKSMITIPNIVLGKALIHNYCHSDLHEQRIKVTFGLEDNPNVVKDTMMEVAEKTNGILLDPAPKIRNLGFVDNGVVYEAVVTLEEFRVFRRVVDEYYSRLWFSYRRVGLTIPYPVMSLDQLAGADMTNTAEDNLDLLNRFSLLRGASEELLLSVASAAKILPYSRGELVTEAGTRCKTVMFILSGEVLMSLKTSSGVRREVAQLTKGDIFGLSSSLLDGVVRCDTFATTDCEILCVRREEMRELLQVAPVISRKIGAINETRRKAAEMAEQGKTRSLSHLANLNSTTKSE